MTRIRSIRPEYRTESSWCLLHDNAPSYTSLVVRRFLAKNNVCVLNYPPYSPNLAPCDYSLFPKIKMKLKGCYLGGISILQVPPTHALQGIPQSNLQQAFDSLINRYDKCIEARRYSFELTIIFTVYNGIKLCDLFESSVFIVLRREPPQLHQKSLHRVKKQLHDPDIPHSWRTSLRAPIPFEVGEGALDILFGRFLSAILVETTTRFQKALSLEGHPAKNEKERTKVLASEGKACEDDTVSPPGVIESRCCLCTPLPSSSTP
ncbi:mariner Mos1 transposase [Trichonephila clavipes]|nr:mariner Mos1 transposase [Trichonephila clavipes]